MLAGGIYQISGNIWCLIFPSTPGRNNSVQDPLLIICEILFFRIFMIILYHAGKIYGFGFMFTVDEKMSLP